jgi:hypothetical protein
LIEPIGQPIAATQIYILDGQRRPVPPGTAGEIYIGGAGVARGDLNRPELTAERFLFDPFSADPTSRMYRTGDIGRLGADGNLEYQGRNDQQIKLRGFRIELGEIEAQLSHHPSVAEAAVVVREQAAGDPHLVAYFVPRGAGPQARIPELRRYLVDRLPEYMIPAVWVTLRQMPLTQNGKIDRRSLPDPRGRPEALGEYVSPSTATERALTAIWSRLLQVDQVGTRDHFIEIGGHSLHAMQLTAEIAAQLEVRLSVIEILQLGTVERLAGLIDSQRSAVQATMGSEVGEYEAGVV